MPKDPLMKQAKRDVRIANRPARQAINRTGVAGTQDFNEAQQRVAQVTKAMLGQLGQIPGAYAAQTGGIIGNITSGIGALGEQLGQNNIGQVPLAEQNAGIANVKAVGAGVIEQVAGQQQNMADYLASGAQQGAVQGAVTSRNYLHDYAKFQKDIRQQKVDLARGTKDDILQRLDQLKQEQFDRTMALKQLGMQQAQIDQANRALDAQIKLEEARARYLRTHPKDGPKKEPPPAPPGTEPDYGTTTSGQWWPSATDTGLGGNAGALGTAMSPSTSLPPNATPQMALQWLQTQPLQSHAGVQQTAQQLAQWLGGPAVVDPGTLTISYPAMESTLEMIDPGGVKRQVIDQFNQMRGGA